MEIAIYPEGGGDPVFLTGELSEEGMQSGEMANSRVMDFPPLVDSDEVGCQDYGNESTELSFQIERTWATSGDAAAYWLEHQAIPRKGRIRLRAQKTSGEDVVERWLLNAGIPKISGRFEGCCSLFRYTITGGRLTPPQ